MYSSLLTLPTTDEYKDLYLDEYNAKQIFTFDNIKVQFPKGKFFHLFKESSTRSKERHKDQWSWTRLQRILWIKKALQDNSADLYEGWDDDKAAYTKERRVCRVDSNYVVVIRLVSATESQILTAYLVDTDRTLEIIKNSPTWTMPDKFKE
ncbi:MAG: hypothetical protein JNN26_05100 [Candidatus Obscuribacter sp.]|nr:hypothetical protein [Candidatus Obscuribacter sp.]